MDAEKELRLLPTLSLYIFTSAKTSFRFGFLFMFGFVSFFLLFRFVFSSVSFPFYFRFVSSKTFCRYRILAFASALPSASSSSSSSFSPFLFKSVDSTSKSSNLTEVIRLPILRWLSDQPNPRIRNDIRTPKTLRDRLPSACIGSYRLLSAPIGSYRLPAHSERK